MKWTAIRKDPGSPKQSPHLSDYQATLADCSWDNIRRELPSLPGKKGFNIAYAAVDCHAEGQLAKHVALRWL